MQSSIRPGISIDIGLHVFPTGKYRLVHDASARAGVIQPSTSSSRAGQWDELALVHTAEYLAKMRDGTLSPDGRRAARAAVVGGDGRGFPADGRRDHPGRAIACGLPGSTKFEVAKRRAERSASDLPTSTFSVVCHIGGGLHHAFPNHGEGFCPFNDVAVAARVLQDARPRAHRDRRSRRAPRQRHRVHLRIRSARVHASRCTSSTTTRCGSRAARSTSGCPTARTTRPSCASSNARCRR